MSHPEHHNQDDLLKHLPEYGVVICRACKFAVQPQALSSHLLRHQIYRNERRHFLSRLSNLGLHEPEDVPVPDPDSFPLADLPVYRGYICNAHGCSHSCVSQKRMFQHWSEAHDERDSKNVKARPAALQTFFRGNKIRYFEINGSLEVATPISGTSASTSRSKTPLNFNQLASPPSTSGDDSDSVPDEVLTLDMQSLQYFHHYIVSPFLVPHRGENESERFWVQTIYTEAYTHQFLMHGILGMAATHMAAEASSKEICRVHRETAINYQSAGMAVFREEMKQPSSTNSTALIAYARYIGFQRLMLQLVEDKYAFSTSQHNDLSSITEMFFMLRGSVELLLRLQHLLPRGSGFALREEDISWMRRSESVEASELHVEETMNIPNALLERLEALPQTLSESGIIEDPTEMRAVVQANTALVVSASCSYTSEGVLGLWNGLESFTQSVPNNFVRMIEAGRPAALIILAHWCPLLLRLEAHYSFLQGQSARLLRIIRANLSPELVLLVADLDYMT